MADVHGATGWLISPEFVVILLLMFVGYIPVIMSSARREFTRWFFFAYTCLFIGVIARIAGDFYAPELMILIERGVGIAMSGMFALVGSYSHFRKIQNLQWNIDKPAAKTEHLAELTTALQGVKRKK